MIIHIIYVNIIFALYMSAISSALNILTQIYSQHKFTYLGNVSIFLIFTFGLIGNLACVTYVQKLKTNMCFFLHSLGYLIFLTGGTLICYCNQYDSGDFQCSTVSIWIITIFGSAISGFCSSGLYVTQNLYISKLSGNASEKGAYYGIGWALLQLSQVLGNLYSTFIIEPLGQFLFFVIMLIIAFTTSLGFIFVVNPHQITITQILDEDSQYNEQSSETELDGITYQITGIMEVWKLKQVQFLTVPMILTGALLSFQWNIMHSIIELSIDMNVANETINKKTFQVMIFLGVMEVIGGIATAILNSKFKKQLVQLSIFVILQVCIFCILINIEYQYFGVCFIIGGLWGFVDCSTTATLLAIISDNFQGDIRVFALFNFLQCFGGMLVTCFSILLECISLFMQHKPCNQNGVFQSYLQSKEVQRVASSDFINIVDDHIN